MFQKRLLLLALLTLTPNLAMGHGGGLNSSGCHNSKTGYYHCHQSRSTGNAPRVLPITSCKVVGISDGDTLTCLTSSKQQIKVRLAEIDAPEKAAPYGQQAKKALSSLVFGKYINLQVQNKDRNGRTVALVIAGNVDVNRTMVSQGAAWVYLQYNKDKTLMAVELKARQARRGLWSLPQADLIPPWEWRRK